MTKPESNDLLSDVAALEEKIVAMRKIPDLTEDQKWRLTCAGAQIGMAGAHLKIFNERRVG